MSKYSIAELFDLSGQVALVTGAAQGIGQAIALRLAEAGASVVAAGHNTDGLRGTKDLIEAAGGRCETVSGDVCDDADLDAFVAKAVDSFLQPRHPRQRGWRNASFHASAGPVRGGFRSNDGAQPA